MKFFLCILALCGLFVNLFAVGYNAIGVAKESSVILSEFSESVNKIIGSVGYIQFYDVSEQLNMIFAKPLVTLSGIEMIGLKVKTPLKADQLTYTATATNAVIKVGANPTFALEAEMSLKWSYKVAGAVIYHGTYKAKLQTEKPQLTFNFLDASSKVTADIIFGWKLSSPVITGFGSHEYLAGVISQVIANKLYPVFHEELNRYNDIIVSSMIYNYYYRAIPLPIENDLKEQLIMKNVFKNFYLLNIESKDYLGFAFTSSVYYPIQHMDQPFNGSFVPVESAKGSIMVYLGSAQVEEVFDIMVKTYAMKTFVLTPKDQKKLMGYEITIGTLTQFHPKLAEDFESNELVDLSFTAHDLAGSPKKYEFGCKFLLHKNPSQVLFDIEKLEWASNFYVNAKSEEPTNHDAGFGLNSFKFSSIQIRQPKLPVYVTKQFLSFLQPLANFASPMDFAIRVVGDHMDWQYVSSEHSATGDLTLYYNPKSA